MVILEIFGHLLFTLELALNGALLIGHLIWIMIASPWGTKRHHARDCYSQFKEVMSDDGRPD